MTEQVDIAIIGAGPVGMALARLLARGPHCVMLIDRQARGNWKNDPRALAVAHGSRQLLESLACWNKETATNIREIHVSQRRGFGRTLLKAEDHDIPALGYVIRYSDLTMRLDTSLTDIPLIDNCIPVRSRMNGQRIELELNRDGQQQTIAAKLVVHAEGSPQPTADINIRDYHQHAIVAEVRPDKAHANRAWERFTPEGPLALLPLGDNYSVVFTTPPERCKQLLMLDNPGFLDALQRQFGRNMHFSSTGPRSAFPLALRLRKKTIGPREIWIGNAAQTLHPVSGQGFNLGLRDAWELACVLMQQIDPGNPAGLAQVEHQRRLDRRGGTVFTDSIVRLFSNDIAPLRMIRGAGLLALDLYPPLHNFVARRMIWGARAWL